MFVHWREIPPLCAYAHTAVAYGSWKALTEGDRGVEVLCIIPYARLAIRGVGRKQIINHTWHSKARGVDASCAMDCLLFAEENIAWLGPLMRWELINRTEDDGRGEKR